MDDAAFERWSKSLEDLRLSRHKEIEQELQEKVDSFRPTEFYQLAHRSLETIMDHWFSIEQESSLNSPSASLNNKTLQTIKAEMESVFEFELDAIERDATTITSRITWNVTETEDARKSFLTIADDTRKKYLLKLKNLSPGEIKNPLPQEPLRPVQYSGSASRGGSGLAAVVMLIVGFLLGGGISVYFMDAKRKSDILCQEEKEKLIVAQRELADSMSLLQSNFADLVQGKSQSIPQLQVEMARIQRVMDAKVDAVKEDFAGQRTRLVKKISAGDRLDRALADLDKDRQRRIKEIQDEYQPNIRVFEKRILLYKDLIGNPS